RDLSLLERDLARLNAAKLEGVASELAVDAATRELLRAPIAGVAPLDWARGKPRAAIVAFGLELLGVLERVHAFALVVGGVGPESFRVAGERPVLVDLARLGETGERLEPGAARAPEILAGAPADRRTDLHGAGVLLRALVEVGEPRELEPGSP